jgi:hypothetical protein
VNLGHLDGQLCDRIFEIFAKNLSYWEPRLDEMTHRPDGRTSAASNFHIRLRSSRPWGMNVWTATLQHPISISDKLPSGPWKTGVRTVEVESAISLSVERVFGPMLTDVRTVVFELRFLPYIWARLDGNPHPPYGCINLPLFGTLERIWSWSITDRHPNGLLRCPNGCKLEQ